MRFYRYDIALGSKEPEVELREFLLVKETPQGYWIREDIPGLYFTTDRKWIPKESRKRFAYPTKAEALYSFIRRKTKQIQYCKRELYYAEECLKIAKEIELK